jgi:hypothetical protein
MMYSEYMHATVEHGSSDKDREEQPWWDKVLVAYCPHGSKYLCQGSKYRYHFKHTIYRDSLSFVDMLIENRVYLSTASRLFQFNIGLSAESRASQQL